jgi:hypothetical protein
MKALLTVALVALTTLTCMAGSHGRTITIKNNTNKKIEATDTGRKGNENNNTVTVGPKRSASLQIRVHEPKGSLFPSSLMPHETTITVSDEKGDNSIKIDEHTTKVIVDEGLELSKE